MIQQFPILIFGDQAIQFISLALINIAIRLFLYLIHFYGPIISVLEIIDNLSESVKAILGWISDFT